MTLKVIDISGYQDASAVSTPGTEAVIVKVSEGTWYVNPNCDSEYQTAKAKGMALGLYHYLNGTGAKAEAEYFTTHSYNYWKEDSVTIWADWESGGNAAWGNGQYVIDFINEVNRIVGKNCCGIYTGSEGVRQAAAIGDKVPLWFAGYPDLRDSWDAPDFMYNIAPWTTLTMWQFTDSQGRLDRSIFYGDRDTWNKLSVKGGGSTPTPTPTPKPQPMNAVEQFKAAGNQFQVSASFNVSKVGLHAGIWQLLSSDLRGDDWDLNGIPLAIITFVNNDGSACANQTWDGTQPRFVFDYPYNHGTIDAYDNNAVGIDYAGYGRIWFDANAWLKA